MKKIMLGILMACLMVSSVLGVVTPTTPSADENINNLIITTYDFEANTDLVPVPASLNYFLNGGYAGTILCDVVGLCQETKSIAGLADNIYTISYADAAGAVYAPGNLIIDKTIPTVNDFNFQAVDNNLSYVIDCVDAGSGIVVEEAQYTIVESQLYTAPGAPVGTDSTIYVPGSTVSLTTLNDLSSISFQQDVSAGYLGHVDVRLDINGNGVYDSGIDDVLVFEYAKVDSTNCDNAPYPTGALNTFDDKGIITDSSYAWLSSGPAGPCGDPGFFHHTLADWKAGQTYGGKTIDGNTQILAIEFEVDNWISDSTSVISSLEVNTLPVENIPLTNNPEVMLNGIYEFRGYCEDKAGNDDWTGITNFNLPASPPVLLSVVSLPSTDLCGTPAANPCNPSQFDGSGAPLDLALKLTFDKNAIVTMVLDGGAPVGPSGSFPDHVISLTLTEGVHDLSID